MRHRGISVIYTSHSSLLLEIMFLAWVTMSCMTNEGRFSEELMVDGIRTHINFTF